MHPSPKPLKPRTLELLQRTLIMVDLPAPLAPCTTTRDESVQYREMLVMVFFSVPGYLKPTCTGEREGREYDRLTVG